LIFSSIFICILFVYYELSYTCKSYEEIIAMNKIALAGYYDVLNSLGLYKWAAPTDMQWGAAMEGAPEHLRKQVASNLGTHTNMMKPTAWPSANHIGGWDAPKAQAASAAPVAKSSPIYGGSVRPPIQRASGILPKATQAPGMLSKMMRFAKPAAGLAALGAVGYGLYRAGAPDEPEQQQEQQQPQPQQYEQQQEQQQPQQYEQIMRQMGPAAYHSYQAYGGPYG
jgi:hypothetical protein